MQSSEIADLVRRADPRGLSELYALIQDRRNFLSSLTQRSFDDTEDDLHDTYLKVARSIQEGKLRDASALGSFICGALRMISRQRMQRELRHRRLLTLLPHPSRGCLVKDILTLEAARAAIGQMPALPDRDRELIERYYLSEQDAEQVVAGMGLRNKHQFAVVHGRARVRLKALCMNKPKPAKNSVS